ncbi:MAG: SulP family inorganic anion transporter [Syntrophobacteraceae bacterium]
MRWPSASAVFPFLGWWKLVNRQTQRADFLAGITSAIIVLPQGIAFAAIAGLPPEYGLYSAIVPAIVAALFGSSLHLISGPTTAISLVVFAKVSTLAQPFTWEYIEMVLALTLIAGAFQLTLGVVRLGAVVNFVSHSVVVGFTFGAAILIATSQAGHFFGIPIPSGKSFLHTWIELVRLLPNTNLYTLAVALTTLVTAASLKYFRPRWPGLLVGMIAGGLMGLALDGKSHGLAMMGALPASLPPFSVPNLSIDTLRTLVPGALAIAMLGLAEAVSIAHSIANQSNQHLDNSQEFIGQGLSNIVGSFFSGYASSGSFTRTGVNYNAGARTPMAAVYAALLLAVIVILIAPLTAYLPIAAMAGVLMLVCCSLVDAQHIKTIFKASKPETVVLAVTFFSTLFIELEFALFSGVILSLLLYLNRTSHPHFTTFANQHEVACGNGHSVKAYNITSPECPQLKIIRIDGSIFFGAANYISEQLQSMTQHRPEQCHILIVGASINFMDVSGCEMLYREGRNLYLEGRQLYMCSLKEEVMEILERGNYAEPGRIIIFASVEEALAKIIPGMDWERCRQCGLHLFKNCPEFPKKISAPDVRADT